MTWKLDSKPRTQLVTKTLAKKFADMDPAPSDRPLSERRLQVYQRILAQGKFRPVTWAMAFCRETGCLYRVNGKHTSTLLAGLEAIPEFYITVEEYLCDTLEDVARLYSTFDSKYQSRSVQDINASFAATVPELAVIPVFIISVGVSGVAYCLDGGVYSTTSPAERAELMFEYQDFFVWTAGILTSGKKGCRDRKESRHLRRVSVVAAMFASWRKSVKAATDFWTAVRDETGVTPDLPDRKLSRLLLTCSIASRVDRSKKKQVDARELYVKCLHAWNAWRKGEETNMQYFAAKPIPDVK